MISMDLPLIAICTSPGFCALPLGMFSDAQTMPITFTLGLRSAIARMAPIMAAPPALSYFIFSMPSAGFNEISAGIEGDPFPHQAEHGLFRRAGWGVGHHDQRGRLVGTLRDAPERAHLLF